jgi:hypothetical protein
MRGYLESYVPYKFPKQFLQESNLLALWGLMLLFVGIRLQNIPTYIVPEICHKVAPISDVCYK